MKVVIKVGGAAMDDPTLLQNCAKAVAQFASEGHQVAVVHGGGAALTRTLAQLGRTSQFIDGLRVTDSDTRDVAIMVLAGQVNKVLVAALCAQGQMAIGMSGGDGLAFRARKKETTGPDLGFVGEIACVEPRWIEAIWANGGIPVISSIALGGDGQYYNINADQMAAACAVGCHADALIFLTDVSGVKDGSGAVIRWLNVSTIHDMVRDSVVHGGMLPKLEACQFALKRGVSRVRILPTSQVEALPQFYFSKIDCGTEVMAA